MSIFKISIFGNLIYYASMKRSTHSDRPLFRHNERTKTRSTSYIRNEVFYSRKIELPFPNITESKEGIKLCS